VGFDTAASVPSRPYAAQVPQRRKVTVVDLEERVREICLDLPEVTVKLSHGAPTFFVRKSFLMLWPDGHHGNHFPHLWAAAPPGVQAELVEAEPDHFFKPPYVGGRGWIGLRLDGKVDWEEVAAVAEDAYRTIAPPKLVAQLDARRAR
jgi:hypothetical protein